MPAPENCHSMTELRAEIDRLDRQLIDLLAARAGYIDRAIEIKACEGLPARITARVDEVIDNARAGAARKGLDPALAGALWSQIVEWSIAREERALGPSKEG
ncbi:MAG: chorismate mutase [Rhodobacteraceae bacterium]|nr:chorismate mutase [Paracoccaceae bacterium]